MNNLREKYRTDLLEHVNKHYFLKKKSRLNWELGCRLGKEPTGRLFTIKARESSKINEDLKKLANDMWDFLFTEKGEQIIRKEHDLETWKHK